MRRVRKRKARSLDRIIQDALHEATDAGNRRGTIAQAMIDCAGALVSTWKDEDRERVVASLELRVKILRDGIDGDALAKLTAERAHNRAAVRNA